LLLLRYDNRSAAVFACVLRCHYDKIKLGVYARLLVACAKCPKIQVLVGLQHLVKAFPAYLDILPKVSSRVKNSQVKSGQAYYLEGVQDLVKSFPTYLDILPKVSSRVKYSQVEVRSGLQSGGAARPWQGLPLILGHFTQVIKCVISALDSEDLCSKYNFYIV
jgi:hypothetical protein